MASLKIIFDGDVIATVKSKKINEDKLKYFLEYADKIEVTSKQAHSIKIYKGTRKTRTIYVYKKDFLPAFNAWLDYGRKDKK